MSHHFEILNSIRDMLVLSLVRTVQMMWQQLHPNKLLFTLFFYYGLIFLFEAEMYVDQLLTLFWYKLTLF